MVIIIASGVYSVQKVIGTNLFREHLNVNDLNFTENNHITRSHLCWSPLAQHGMVCARACLCVEETPVLVI